MLLCTLVPYPLLVELNEVASWGPLTTCSLDGLFDDRKLIIGTKLDFRLGLILQLSRSLPCHRL